MFVKKMLVGVPSTEQCCRYCPLIRCWNSLVFLSIFSKSKLNLLLIPVYLYVMPWKFHFHNNVHDLKESPAVIVFKKKKDYS